ncbi:hypothetical protein Q1695_007762 [Nippostrongylus brasiliensis]|nr:hypothetical protein Q1695_007762 [Nippostrongylus brasiliensis]
MMFIARRWISRQKQIIVLVFLSTLWLLMWSSPSLFYGLIQALRIENAVPLIIVITPTYMRPERLGDLTRLSNTLRLVPHVYWIVVEDGNSTNPLVEGILNRTNHRFTYLSGITPKGYNHRGWYQRSLAITYLRKNAERITRYYRTAVVYFADDDNSYDTRVFTDYIRNVRKLGMWAVGLSGGRYVEYPVAVNGTVIFNAWTPKRTFAIDMAGFAINLEYILASSAVFGKHCPRGYEAPETCFLEDLGFKRTDIEVFGDKNEEGPNDVLVWHTKTILGSYKMPPNETVPYAYETPRTNTKK